MLSVIIPTANDERALVRTLAMLVPAAMAGLVKDVVVADRQSQDATLEAADAAGCTIIASDAALATRLKMAASAARAPWLLFLRPGIVLDPAWADEASRFIQDIDAGRIAAAAGFFARVSALRTPASRFAEIGRALRAAFVTRGPTPDQGLLIAKQTYDSLGAHRGGVDPESDLLARIGRRRLVALRCVAERVVA